MSTSVFFVDGDGFAARGARSFVTRKARSRKNWSTKSGKAADRRKIDTRLHETAMEALHWAQDEDATGSEDTKAALVGPKRTKPWPHWTDGAGTDGLVPYLTMETGVNTDSYDPFESLAAPLKSRDSAILTYFTPAICGIHTPVRGDVQREVLQKAWLAPGLRHTAFLQGLVSLASFDLGVARFDQPEHFERCLLHKVRAMAAVRANLDDPALAIGDDNIAAVFNLVCIEEKTFMFAATIPPEELAKSPGLMALVHSSLQNRAAHMNGLKRMIDLRGGIQALGTMRALQSYVIRWAVTAEAAALIYPLPPQQSPIVEDKPATFGDENDGNNSPAGDVSPVDAFVPPICLPETLMNELYSYPACSRFLALGSQMARGCQTAGVHPHLVHLVFLTDCLVRDTVSWLEKDQRNEHGWDLVDAQNLSSLLIDNITRWMLANEAILSPADSVVSLCLFIFAAYFTLPFRKTFGSLYGVRDRLARLLSPKSNVTNVLREAGIDVWAALMVGMVSAGVAGEQRDFLMGVARTWLVEHQPQALSWEDVRACLDQCIWFPGPLEENAKEVWAELCGNGNVRESWKKDVDKPCLAR